MLKKALLVIDMTQDFLLKSYNPNLALEKGLTLIPKIRQLQETFQKNGYPVIYATDRHLENDYELKKWGFHSMKGAPGSKIIDGLITEGLYTLERSWGASDIDAIKPGHLLFEVEKGTYSSFTDDGGKPTAMGALLQRLGFNPGDKLFITGIHTNCCDKHTAADAYFRGYTSVMVNDCVAAFEDPEGAMGMGHDQALRYEEFWYEAEVKPSNTVITELLAN